LLQALLVFAAPPFDVLARRSVRQSLHPFTPIELVRRIERASLTHSDAARDADAEVRLIKKRVERFIARAADDDDDDDSRAFSPVVCRRTSWTLVPRGTRGTPSVRVDRSSFSSSARAAVVVVCRRRMLWMDGCDGWMCLQTGFFLFFLKHSNDHL